MSALDNVIQQELNRTRKMLTKTIKALAAIAHRKPAGMIESPWVELGRLIDLADKTLIEIDQLDNPKDNDIS